MRFKGLKFKIDNNIVDFIIDLTFVVRFSVTNINYKNSPGYMEKSSGTLP